MMNLTVPPWNVEFCQIIRYLNNYGIMQFFLPSLGPLAVSDHATGKALSGKCLVITKHRINKA